MHTIVWRKLWSAHLLRLVSFLGLLGVCICLPTVQAVVTDSAWVVSSPFDTPRVVNGDGDLSPSSRDELFRSKMSIFADQDCEDRDYYQESSGVLVSGCWYETEIGELSEAGYSVKPKGKQAASIDGWGSEHFPTKNPNIFIETPLHVDDGLMGLNLWRAEDMVFSEIWPYGNEGPMYYKMPASGAHVIKNMDGTPYTFNNNLLYSNVWYSENAEWMLIRYDEGYVDLFNLNDFSWKRINTVYTGFGSFTISDNGRYVVEAVLGGQPRVIDTALCEGENCASVDLSQALSRVGVAGESVSVPKFYDNETIGIYAPMLDSDENSREWEYIIQAPNTYNRNYMALGDSFASGEGAGWYTDETDGEGRGSNECHVSRFSYAFRLQAELGFGATRNLACSGAEVRHVLNEVQQISREGVAIDEFVAGTYAQNDFVEAGFPDTITISIGGNDIGFSSKIRRCVLQADTCFKSYEDRVEVVYEINRQYDHLVNTYEEVKKNTRKGTPIYVIGYPYILEDRGKCRSGLLKFNGEEIKFSEQLINYLNMVIERAARDAGVRYVDATHALEGYRLCEIDTLQAAVNDFSLLGQELYDPYITASFHPNQLGHQLLAHTILDKTSRMRVENPRAENELSAPNSYDDLVILDKRTRSGRPIYDLYYAKDPSWLDYLFIDSHVRQIVQGSLYNVAPNTPYSLYIESEPLLLGEFMSDDDGNITVDYRLPKGFEPGWHTLHLKGLGATGRLIDIYKGVYVSDTGGRFSKTVWPAHQYVPGKSAPTTEIVPLAEATLMPNTSIVHEQIGPKEVKVGHDTAWIIMAIICSIVVIIGTLVLYRVVTK